MYFYKIFFAALLAFMFIESSLAMCKGDKNAVPSNCSNQCNQNCEKKICLQACFKGCSCLSSYVYDEAVKKCVKPNACSNRH